MTLKEIEQEMLKEDMEFELTFKGGIKVLATVREINDVVAIEKLKNHYGDLLEKAEMIWLEDLEYDNKR